MNIVIDINHYSAVFNRQVDVYQRYAGKIPRSKAYCHISRMRAGQNGRHFLWKISYKILLTLLSTYQPINKSAIIQRRAHHHFGNGPLTRCAKLRVAHAPGMPGRFLCHRLQRKPLVNDPGIRHGMCVTHVPWCKSGSLIRVGGENVSGFPGACATHSFA